MTDVTPPMTVAKALTVLADATQHERADDPTPVMVSDYYGSHGWRFAARAEIGYFKQVEASYHDRTVGHLTRNPDDGPRVAALIAPYHEHIDDRDVDKAATVPQLAKLLEHLALVDPDMLVVVPDHEYDDKALFAPLDTHMDYEVYDPEAEHHHGVWGHDITDGPAVLVLWPARDFTPPPPETPTPAPAPIPPRPVNWFARLAQTRTWTDEYGREHAVASMNCATAYDALMWLEKHANSIANQIIAYLLGDATAVVDHDGVGPRPLLESAVAVADPRGWITTTPLALALAVQAD